MGGVYLTRLGVYPERAEPFGFAWMLSYYMDLAHGKQLCVLMTGGSALSMEAY